MPVVPFPLAGTRRRPRFALPALPALPAWFIAATQLVAFAAAAASPGLRINEVLSRNRTGLADDRGARSDWIELHNAGPRAVPLAGWSLSDDTGRPRQWTFLDGVLEAGGFLLVRASGEDRQPLPSPPLDPGAIAGLRVWLKADAIDPIDPTQVRTSGGNRFVARWRDLSGGRRDARQAAGAAQPMWVPGPVPAVRFDGINDLLGLDGVPATNAFTLFAVIRSSAAHEADEISPSGVGGTSGQRWLFGAAQGGATGAGLGISAGTNGVAVYEHGDAYMPALAGFIGPLGNGPVVLSVAYGDRRPRLGVQGHPPSPGVASSREPVTAPTEIGAGPYGAWAGDLLEVLVYDRTLPEPERRAVEVGLAERHGIALQASYHANFRLDAEGERLLLTRPDGGVAETWEVPAMPQDLSWGPGIGGGEERFYFAQPTPGGANAGEGATAFLASPSFSVPAGFLAVATPVRLSAPDPDVEIRYTLDGSEPGAASPLYSGALMVTNRTLRPNQFSAIPTAPGWQPPLGFVFKGTVIRARAFRARSIPSVVATATYFVHPAGRGRYSLPVVSLATDPANFFDADTGIYVPGRAEGGNYAQAGDAWERPVHVEFFETNGVRVIGQESGVRIHGNTSFGFPVKALRLHPENQRGDGPFRHRIFPDLEVDTFHRLLLRPSGHDHHLTMMRDGLMQGMVRETGLDGQAYRPAVLFVNGEYWGIHNLQEAFEKHYFASNHPGVDPEAVDYLEGYAPGAYAYEGDATIYHELVRYLETHPVTGPGAWEFVQSRMEVDNFRDYKLAEILYYRWDIGNHRLWRRRTPGGRLRWILFDCDVGFGGFWSEPRPWAFDMLSATIDPTGSLHGHNNPTTVFLLGTLLGHPEFRRGFINRAADLMNSTLSTPRMLAFIDRFAAGIAPEIAEHANRWRAPASRAAWETQVEALREFARRRPGHFRDHLIRRFALGGTVQVRLAADPAPGGIVRCGTLEPAGTPSEPWQGTYFRNHPIILEAVPRPGWRFVRWKGLPEIAGRIVTLSLAADVDAQAEFAPAGGPRFAGTLRHADGSLEFRLQSAPGSRVQVQRSPDLRAWTDDRDLTTDPAGEASWREPAVDAMRFLRLRTP